MYAKLLEEELSHVVPRGSKFGISKSDIFINKALTLCGCFIVDTWLYVCYNSIIKLAYEECKQNES
jgi:hypothetical protein